jgi:hypothetical protein
MAPGVAAALVATVTGLARGDSGHVRLQLHGHDHPAITQELDGFASRYANQIEHVYVDHRPLSEEIRDANEVLAARITAVEGQTEGEKSRER